MSTEYYPVEVRSLYKPETRVPVGSIRLWVEIVLTEADKHARNTDASRNENSLTSSNSGSRADFDSVVAKRKPWEISMMPPGGFELRVIVYDILNCPIDDPEGLTDIYITCTMPSYDPLIEMKTDTHIRSEGYVCFHYAGFF